MKGSSLGFVWVSVLVLGVGVVVMTLVGLVCGFILAIAPATAI